LSEDDQKFYDDFKVNVSQQSKSRHPNYEYNYTIQGTADRQEKTAKESESYDFVVATARFLYKTMTTSVDKSSSNSINRAINFVSGTAQYASTTDQAMVSSIASLAHNGASKNSVITINLYTDEHGQYGKNLLQARFNLLKKTLENNGIASNRILKGTVAIDVPDDKLNGRNNKTVFTITTTTSTTTTTTSNSDEPEVQPRTNYGVPFKF